MTPPGGQSFHRIAFFDILTARGLTGRGRFFEQCFRVPRRDSRRF